MTQAEDVGRRAAPSPTAPVGGRIEATGEPLLTIKDLRVAFRLGKAQGVVQRVQAVGRGDQGVSFEVPENTTV